MASVEPAGIKPSLNQSFGKETFTSSSETVNRSGYQMLGGVCKKNTSKLEVVNT